ncbi:hypothetical protein N7510_001613 [Penicillium lagena]|uniref:uncharacterized protein n=1 Tax=Penicillium lagena TaxID=94218 RepID=UPI00254177F6|nr:uncharacterized protein N7510_001613 [Penicillium lagena]KAJ5625304.1 hypothetical protein N7510_001613 [Penicillium lagena]
MRAAKLFSWASLVLSSVASEHSIWPLGNGFEIAVDKQTNHLFITQRGSTIWDTVPGQSFLGASAGDDIILESSGNFKIEQVDRNKCENQQVTQVSHRAWNDSFNDRAVVISGHLTSCGDETSKFWVAFWVPLNLSDRVAFHVNVNPVDTSADPLNKIFLTYRSLETEDFYGLGGQASFSSLKNQTVPIFSREQGVGRGDQPTTRLEDADSFFSGGNKFTTYTAVPQYISSTARVFHLTQESTAYANFDFRDPLAVTMRYDALNVSGYFMQANNILNGISMLTEYTGRMTDLPRWVDSGAVLGIQGGQEKVNKIVKEGLQQKCPIAGVWLQDW